MTGTTAIAYCFDQAFANYAAVSTLSLVSNSKRRLSVHWCVSREMVSQIEKMLELSELKKFSDIHIVPLEIDQFQNWKTGFHFAPSNYYRLLLPSCLPEETILYLDSDTLILSDISDLLEIDLGSRVLAGVKDPGGARTSKVPRKQDDVYVNTGVLLLNARQLREDGFLEKCRNIHAEYEKDILWVDQCIINKYGEDRKEILPEKWNRQVFPNTLDRKAVEEITAEDGSGILHFVGPVKPWQQWCNPMIADYWFSYARRLPALNIKPTEMASVDHAIALAMTLDRMEMFKEASSIKNRIISSLLQRNTA